MPENICNIPNIRLTANICSPIEINVNVRGSINKIRLIIKCMNMHLG